MRVGAVLMDFRLIVSNLPKSYPAKKGKTKSILPPTLFRKDPTLDLGSFAKKLGRLIPFEFSPRDDLLITNP